jgi:hypothetical protein
MRKKEDPIIYNLDNQPVVNTDTGEFFQDFNNDQKDVIRFCLENRWSVRGFAYTSLPADYMLCIVEYLFKQLSSLEHVNDIDIWKVVNTDYDLEHFHEAIAGLKYGFNASDKLILAAKQPLQMLNLACVAKSYGMDIADKINNGEDYETLYDSVHKRINKSEAKDDAIRKFNSFTFN